MFRILCFWLLMFSAAALMASNSVQVNCDAGQSLNTAISQLPKEGPSTVTVQGTCKEYVYITGFENLTVKGLPGATLVQPSVVPVNVFVVLMNIRASSSVLIENLNFQSTSSSPSPIGIGGGSTDVRLRNLKLDGGISGIIIYERSQVSIAFVSVTNSGYASLAMFDGSDVHVESSTFEDTTGTSWHSGIFLGASHLTIRRTSISNMQVGIYAGDGSIADLGDFDNYYPSGGVSDVVIDNPAGLNLNGVVVDGGSSLSVTSAVLRILNAGQTWGGNSGGILVSGGSTIYGGGKLIISGSQGQGIYVRDDSHATLDGSSITGSVHGGLVAVNLSTISNVNPVTVSGNAMDVFCDLTSVITGGLKIVNAKTFDCQNLLPGDSVPVP